MRETVHGEQTLRAEGTRLLRDALPPALRESLLRMQPGQAWEKIPSCSIGTLMIVTKLYCYIEN